MIVAEVLAGIGLWFGDGWTFADAVPNLVVPNFLVTDSRLLTAVRESLRLPFAAFRLDGRETATSGRPGGCVAVLPLLSSDNGDVELVVGVRPGQSRLDPEDLRCSVSWSPRRPTDAPASPVAHRHPRGEYPGELGLGDGKARDDAEVSQEHWFLPRKVRAHCPRHCTACPDRLPGHRGQGPG
ncbi:MAG TPA: hypothetical protein VGD48_04775 [Kutzneria sp.]